MDVINDALIAQQLYEEELRCINDEHIAEMYHSQDQQDMYEKLRKLQITNTSYKAMTIEENAAYYNIRGRQKYYEVDDTVADFHVPKQKSKTSYEFRFKNKDEEYAIVTQTEGLKRNVMCKCLDGKTRLCYRPREFDACFKNVYKGDGVLIQVRDGEQGKLVLKYSSAFWSRLHASGQLTRLDGFHKLPHEVVLYLLQTRFDHSTSWFNTLQLVNSVFRDIVKSLRNTI
eukprot:Phypoly_transcript_14766.p1 GENE.Phypoly_transcript_14766~~Phypoly_transcript_14766.p1  ORF type:complete len:229 (+),score=26.13 Phypoly_transcript_14766:83-769(+)